MQEAEAGMVCLHPRDPSTWEQKQESHHKFRASLAYIKSSWPAAVTDDLRISRSTRRQGVTLRERKLLGS